MTGLSVAAPCGLEKVRGWNGVGRAERAVVITAACFALAAAFAVAGAPADGTDDEGAPRTITGRVESIRAEQEGRVPVSVRPYAQMYFLYRSHPHFEDLLRLLKEAQSDRRPVRCTFRGYSGRIVAVEWAEEDEGKTGSGR